MNTSIEKGKSPRNPIITPLPVLGMTSLRQGLSIRGYCNLQSTEFQGRMSSMTSSHEEVLTVSPLSTNEKLTIRLGRIELIVDPSNKKSYFPYEC